MAVLCSFTCKECNTPKREAVASSDYSDTCHACKTRLANKARREFLAGKAGLTVEERLAWIEAWIYDYKPERNINDIVFG